MPRTFRWIAIAGAAMVGGALLWSTAQSQPLEPDGCRRACQAEYQRCTEACSEHGDPVECDGDCRDALEDCNAACR